MEKPGKNIAHVRSRWSSNRSVCCTLAKLSLCFPFGLAFRPPPLAIYVYEDYLSETASPFYCRHVWELSYRAISGRRVHESARWRRRRWFFGYSSSKLLFSRPSSWPFPRFLFLESWVLINERVCIFVKFRRKMREQNRKIICNPQRPLQSLRL